MVFQQHPQRSGISIKIPLKGQVEEKLGPKWALPRIILTLNLNNNDLGAMLINRLIRPELKPNLLKALNLVLFLLGISFRQQPTSRFA